MSGPYRTTKMTRAMREADARKRCANNLKEIVLAVLNCSDTHDGNMPPFSGYYPIDKPTRLNGYGTLFFHILPYIEQDRVYTDSLDKGGTRGYSVWFNGTYARPIKTYFCPADTSNKGELFEGWLATTGYAANFMVFGDAEAEDRLRGVHKYPAFIADGTSNTVVFTERYQLCNGEPNGWGYAADSVRAPGYGLYAPVFFQVTPALKDCEPGTPQSPHPGGINAGFADGHVTFIRERVSWASWYALTTPNAGDVPRNDW